jgi:hypothetical protein
MALPLPPFILPLHNHARVSPSWPNRNKNNRRPTLRLSSAAVAWIRQEFVANSIF